MKQILLGATLCLALTPPPSRAEGFPVLKIPTFTAQALSWAVLSGPDDILSWYYTLNLASINRDAGVPELDCTLRHAEQGGGIDCIPDRQSFASPFTLRFVSDDLWSFNEETGAHSLAGPTAEQLYTLLGHLSESEESWNEWYGTDNYSSGHYISEDREDFSLRTSFGSRLEPADAILCSRVISNETQNTSCTFLKLPPDEEAK